MILVYRAWLVVSALSMRGTMRGMSGVREITRVTDTEAQVIRSSDPTPWLAPHRFAPGQSGNPHGTRAKSLKEILQGAPLQRKLDFAEHLWRGAMQEHSPTAVRYAALILEHSGEGAAFRLSLESSGWDSFQLQLATALGLVQAPADPETSEPAPDPAPAPAPKPRRKR